MRFYSHLSDDERDQIAILRVAGRSMGAIARALGRAKTTISREPLPSGGYSPLHAAGAYQLRRRREAILEREAAFAQHGLLRTMRDMTTWYCDAYASWQKGGVEKGNRRLRRWLPPARLEIDTANRPTGRFDPFARQPVSQGHTRLSGLRKPNAILASPVQCSGYMAFRVGPPAPVPVEGAEGGARGFRSRDGDWA
jgi:IS30 family transposase